MSRREDCPHIRGALIAYYQSKNLATNQVGGKVRADMERLREQGFLSQEYDNFVTLKQLFKWSDSREGHNYWSIRQSAYEKYLESQGLKLTHC